MIGNIIENATRLKKSFTTATNIVSVSGTSETALYLLKNPSSNRLPLLLTHFVFGLDSATARSKARIYKNATVTSDGTALTIVNNYIEETQVNSAAEAFKSPTVSAFGTILNMALIPTDIGSRGLNRTYFLHPGNNILITVENSTASTGSFVDCYWLEGV